MAPDTQERRYRLHGSAAIEHAEAYGGSLRASVRDGIGTEAPAVAISIGEARELAGRDPTAVYLDTNLCESCLAAGDHRPAVTRHRDPDRSGYALCAGCAETEDAPPPPVP